MSDKPSLLVSAVTPELIVETVFDREKGTTAFAVARDGAVTTLPDVTRGDKTYRPVSPENNLLKHQAVILPSAPVECGATPELLADISIYMRRYVSLTEEAAALSAAYVLLTWVYDAFNELPYLRFRGDYGTGKTRALTVIGSLCYKAFFASGASTVSPIFHTLDMFRGTLIFDEADFRFTDEKAELVKILNNGNARGFPVLRTEVNQRREFDPRAFLVYGPKVIGMRRSYDDRALESRFLTVEMEPGKAGGMPLNLPGGQKEESLQLRNKLIMYRLRNRQSIALDPSLADPLLEPRMNQILLPLLSVLPDEDHRAPVRAAATALQAGIMADREGSTDGLILSVLSGLMTEGKPVALTAVTTAFMATHGRDYERPITTRWVGTVLRRLGIVLYKSNSMILIAPGQEERVVALCARHGVGKKECCELEHGSDEVTK